MLPMTRPLHDELVCSALVRCCRSFRLPFKTLAREVLGLPELRANYFSIWPLGPIAPFLGTTAQLLLWEHTPFGFATGFLSGPSYVLANQVAMTGAPRISLLSAVMQNVSAEVHLRRLCPECGDAELSKRGEAYWHRSHNLPGVFTCQIHGCALRETTIPASATLKTVYTLPHECRQTKSLKAPATPAQKRLELRATRLLTRTPAPGENRGASFYRGLASRFDWLTQSREVNEKALVRLLTGAYSPQFLSMCGVSPDKWAVHAFRPNVQFVASPLRHLLLECALHEVQPGHLGTLDHIPTGPPPTHANSADAFYAQAAKRELRNVLRTEVVLTTEQFLRRAGAYGVYRHRMDELPLLRKVVLEFRASGASVKPLQSGKRLFRSRLDELVP